MEDSEGGDDDCDNDDGDEDDDDDEESFCENQISSGPHLEWQAASSGCNSFDSALIFSFLAADRGGDLQIDGCHALIIISKV